LKESYISSVRETFSLNVAEGGERAIPCVGRQGWGPIITWLRQDREIAEWLTEAEAAILECDRLQDLPVWKGVLTYQGFDIKRILRNMRESFKTYMELSEPREETIDIVVHGRKIAFRYTNRESMVKDIEFLIFFFAEGGPTNTKYTAKSHKDISTITNWLIEKYKINITVNLPLTAIGPDVVTIPRIVACFPGKICEFFHRGYGNALVSFLELNIRNPENLSRCILCPHFTALLPTELMRISTDMHVISFLVHIIVDDVLHKKKGNYTPLENIYTRYAAEYHTPATPQDARVTFCRRMGLLTHDGRHFINQITDQTQWCLERIRVLRPNDPRLEQVIADVLRLV